MSGQLGNYFKDVGLLEKKNELIYLILKYLNNEKTLQNLQEFAWETIEFFNKSELSPCQEFEKEFWYAIWQIQHLSDEEHEKDGVTQKALSDALDYLENKKSIPENFIGRRP